MIYLMKVRSHLLAIALFIMAGSCFAINTAEYFPGLKSDSDGRIETLNNEGAMAPAATGAEVWLLKDLQQQSTKDLQVLEIGPAYGRLPVELFKAGFSGTYTAVDLSAEHLKYLQEAVNKCPLSKGKVKTVVGRFPSDTSNLPSNYYNIIVVTHVFHFLKPEQFNDAVKELHRLLAPQGKLYVTAKTPYSNRYRSFIPVYEQRVRANQVNPGYIDPVSDWVDSSTVTAEKLKSLQSRHLYFFSSADLNSIFRRNNFEVAICEEAPLGYMSAIWQAPDNYVNREDVVLLAIKR